MEFVIKVPGSSANLGCGFDTLAVAISVYLIVYVKYAYQEQDNYKIKNLSIMEITTDIETNLILKTARMVANLFDLELPFVEIKIKNEIPLKRGMGSSSAAIVAGIVLADRLCNLGLSKEQMLNIGFLLEPHTDNISASLYGNLTISLTNGIADKYRELFINGKMLIKDLPMVCSSLSLEVSSDINMSIFVPEYELGTKESRDILPDKYSINDIINNIQRSSLLSNILTKNVMISDTIRHSLFNDMIHQSPRVKLIPGAKELFEQVDYLISNHKKLLGIYLSGAGPCIGIIYKDDYWDITNEIIKILNDNSTFEWVSKNIEIDRYGCLVYENANTRSEYIYNQGMNIQW